MSIFKNPCFKKIVLHLFSLFIKFGEKFQMAIFLEFQDEIFFLRNRNFSSNFWICIQIVLFVFFQRIYFTVELTLKVPVGVVDDTNGKF